MLPLTHRWFMIDSPLLRESRVAAHVVDVELEIAASHDREDQAQAVFGLERVRQVHHEPAEEKRTTFVTEKYYTGLHVLSSSYNFLY